jgi:hypothetical protein
MNGSSIYFKSLVTVLSCAGLFSLIAIPLIFHKIPRNRVYGFRTLKTLSSDEIWYDANAYFGRAFVVANFSTSLLMLITYYFQQDIPQEYFIKLSLVILIAPSVLAVILTFHRIRFL